jgi:hypothetical protein
MADVHEWDDKIRSEQNRQAIQDEQNLRVLSGTSSKPGMGELRVAEHFAMPQAEKVNALTKELATLPEGSDRAKQIKATIGGNKEAWVVQTAENTPSLPSYTALGLVQKIWAPSLSTEADYRIAEQRRKLNDPRTQEENALKRYAAGYEINRFAERLNIPAGEIPVSLSVSDNGDLVVDSRPFKDRLVRSRQEHNAKVAGYTSWADAPTEYAKAQGYYDYNNAPESVKTMAANMQQALAGDAEYWANREIVRAGQVGRHVTFVDTDPNKTNEWLATLPPISRDVMSALVPEQAISLTPKASEFQPSPRGSYLMHVINGTLAVVAAHEMAYARKRPDFIPALPAAAFTGKWDVEADPWRKWGTDLIESQTASTPEESLQMVKDIRSNPIIAMHFANMGQNLIEDYLTQDWAKAQGWTPEQAKEYAGWGALSFGAFGFLTGDMAMPDPVSMLFSAAGAGLKWGGAGLKEFKYANEANILRAGAEDAAKDYAKFIDDIHATDPVVADILEMRIAQDHQMNPTLRAAIRKAESDAADAAERAKSLREAANVAPGDEAANLAAAQAEADSRTYQAAVAAQKRMVLESSFENYENGDRAMGKVAEKVWKDWQAAKQKAEEAAAAHAAFMVKHGVDLEKVTAATKTWEEASGVVAQAGTDLRVAQTAKKEAILAAKAELEAARADLSAAVKSGDTPTKVAAAERSAEASAKLKSLGTKENEYNVAIKAAVEAKKTADSALETAKLGKMAAGTTHGTVLTESSKLASAVERTAARQGKLEGSSHLLGLDLTSGVHPSAQVYERMKSAVAAAKINEASMLAHVQNGQDIIRQAEKIIGAAQKEADAASRATGWRDTALRMADDMQNGIKEYQSWKDTSAVYKDIIGKSKVTDAKAVAAAAGGVPINPEPFMQSMIKEYGQEAVDHAMSERGPFAAALRKIEGARSPSTMQGLFQRGSVQDVVPVSMTREEYTILQDHPTFMTMAKRRSGPNAASAAMVEAMEIARKMDPSVAKPKALGLRMLHTAEQLYDSMFPSDVLRNKIGPTSSAVQDVIKGTTNLSAQLDDELLTIVRKSRIEDLDYDIVKQVVERFGFDSSIADRAGRGGFSVSKVTGQLFYSEEERAVTQIAALVQYMDTTRGLEYVGGKTFVNTMSHETSWMIARRKMVFGEERSRVWNNAMDAWENECKKIQIDYEEAIRAYEEEGSRLGGTRGPTGRGGFPDDTGTTGGGGSSGGGPSGGGAAGDLTGDLEDATEYTTTQPIPEVLEPTEAGRRPAPKPVEPEVLEPTEAGVRTPPEPVATPEPVAPVEPEPVVTPEPEPIVEPEPVPTPEPIAPVEPEPISAPEPTVGPETATPDSGPAKRQIGDYPDQTQERIDFHSKLQSLPNAKKRTVKQVLVIAASTSRDRRVKAMTELMVKEHGSLLSKIKLSFKAHKQPNVAGWFDGESVFIHPQKSSPYILLHEAVHAVTSNIMDMVESSLARGRSSGTTKEVEDAIDNLEGIRKALLGPSTGTKFEAAYGFTNTHEFVAEAFANPVFQDYLKTHKLTKIGGEWQVHYMPTKDIPWPDTPILSVAESLWTKFVDSISKIIGFKDTDALSHVIANTDVIMKEVKATKWWIPQKMPDRGAEIVADLSDITASGILERPAPPVFPPKPTLGPSTGEAMSPISALSRAWLPGFTYTSTSVADVLETAAIKKLRDNMLKNGTYLDMMVDLRGIMQRPPGIGMGESEWSVSRAMGFSSRAVGHARILAHGDDLLYRAIGGRLTAQEASDFNKALCGEWAKVEDFGGVIKTFNRFGMPITQVGPKGADSSKIELRLMQVGQDPSGEAFFMGQNLLKTIEENMPNIVKQLEKRPATVHLPEQILGVQAEQWLIGQWKKSLITGIAIPNMHYWAANVAGDFSQMWFTPGVGPFTAAKQSFNNLPANIPGIGPIFQDFMSEMSYKAQGKPVLGTLTNAFFNPYLSGFWNGTEGTIRFKSGLQVEMSTLRKWAVEDGILDTFLHEELPQAFSRVTPNVFKRAVSGWSDYITQFANFAQQRQRSGLYLELLQQGYTRNEAKRLTLDALYDWKHSVAEGELSGFAKKIPFYRFFRLQQRQAFSALTDCFLKPEQTFKLAAVGQSRIGAVRSQRALIDLMGQAQSWLTPESQAPYNDAQAQRDALHTLIRPPQLRDRGVLYVDRNKDEYVRALQNVSGNIKTHTATALFPFTPIDGMSMQFAVLEGLAAMVAPKEMLAPDWKEAFWEPVLNVLGPTVRDPAKAFLNDMGQDPGGVRGGSTSTVSPGEAAVMNLFSVSGLTERVEQNEKGELRAPAIQAWAFRSLVPFFGSEAPKFLDSTLYNNPATLVYRDKLRRAARDREMANVSTNPEERLALLQKAEQLENEAPNEVGAMMSWFLRKQLAVITPYNPDEVVKQRRDAVKRAYTDVSKELEPIPFSGFAPPDSEK